MSDTPSPALVVTRVPIDSIFPDPANANTHSEEDILGLIAKLSVFTQVEPLVVQAKTRKVIGGNGRLEAMKRLGWAEVDVCFQDIDNVTATAMGIALNNRKSRMDETITAQHLRALQSEDFDLAATGFTDDEVDKLIEGLGSDLLGEKPQPEKKSRQKKPMSCPECGHEFNK